jgi:hypothetical protein
MIVMNVQYRSARVVAVVLIVVGGLAPGAQADGTGWPLEQSAYWLDGLVRLGYALHDDYLINKARSRLDLVVDGVLKGGGVVHLIEAQERRR